MLPVGRLLPPSIEVPHSILSVSIDSSNRPLTVSYSAIDASVSVSTVEVREDRVLATAARRLMVERVIDLIDVLIAYCQWVSDCAQT